MIQGLYSTIVGAGWLAPSEFWACHPRELWWLIEARRPPRMYGRMTEDEVRAIYEETYGTN